MSPVSPLPPAETPDPSPPSSWVTADDVARRMLRELTTGEALGVEQLIESATALIAEAAGKDDAWALALDPIPQALKALTLEVVSRVLGNPELLDIQQEQVGSYSYRTTFGRNPDGQPGIMLSDEEGRLARRIINGINSGSAHLESIPEDVWPWPYPWPMFGRPYQNLEDGQGDSGYWIH